LEKRKGPTVLDNGLLLARPYFKAQRNEHLKTSPIRERSPACPRFFTPFRDVDEMYA